MKKFLFLLLLLSSVTVLAACSQMLTIDQHVKDVKEDLPKGHTLIDTQKVYTTSKDFPDVLFIKSTKENSIVEIHHYNKKEKVWSIIFEDKTHNNYGGLEDLSLLFTGVYNDEDSEHIFIGYRGGNGGFLNFYILGKDSNGGIYQVFNKMMNKFENSHLKINDDGFDLLSNDSLSESYIWNGSSYILKE